MIKIKGYFKNDFIVDLDVDSFDDICEGKMSLQKSDELITEAIEKKYGVYPDYIFVENPIKN